MTHTGSNSIGLIADSCCDTTPAMREELGLHIAPLKITVDGNIEFVDDGTIHIPDLLTAMRLSKRGVTTAAPSPGEYAELMCKYAACVVVTLSSKLSGSYNAAVAGRDLVLETCPDKQILIVDSKSAASGELRIIMHAKELLKQGIGIDALREKLPAFVDNMRTLFVLEDLGNLIKNGRINKFAGLVGSILMLRPIMSENGHGEIIALEKIRGTKRALARMTEIVADKTKGMADQILTLSYCNCATRAAELRDHILKKCEAVSDVVLVPTGGISTVYANDGGVVLALDEK